MQISGSCQYNSVLVAYDMAVLVISLTYLGIMCKRSCGIIPIYCTSTGARGHKHSNLYFVCVCMSITGGSALSSSQNQGRLCTLGNQFGDHSKANEQCATLVF